MIEAHGSGLFTIDHPLRMLGAEFGTRTTIVSLPRGGTVLFAPGPLSHDDRRSIGELGEVRAVVAPNRFHHLFVADALQAFPQAELFVAPGLREKLPKLPAGTPLDDVPPALWKGVLDQRVVQPSSVLGEVAFLHRASRTLILCDLVMSFRDAPDVWTAGVRRVFGVHRRFGPSRVVRLLLRRDRDAARASIAALLEWDFERVVMTHGAILHEHGRARLADAFDGL